MIARATIELLAGLLALVGLPLSLLGTLKLGDTITAVISQALVVSIEPAPKSGSDAVEGAAAGRTLALPESRG